MFPGQCLKVHMGMYLHVHVHACVCVCVCVTAFNKIFRLKTKARPNEPSASVLSSQSEMSSDSSCGLGRGSCLHPIENTDRC